jgi:hypothetical protein
MLTGNADRAYYLSSLDPGVGKSTAIITWLCTYLECREAYGDHGSMICFDRLEEIKRFVTECNLPDDSYAVLVSDSDERSRRLNGMGRGSADANNGLVLFTTKEQIIRRSKGKRFSDTSLFFYQGKPRPVRIWDESLIAGKPLTLERRKISKLPDDIAKSNTALADKVENIAIALRSSMNGDVYLMPDLGVSVSEMLYSFKWSSVENKETAETLATLFGREVTVRTDDRGHIAVDCGESVPDDLTPCLVTDASGRVRDTYKLQQRHRGDLVRLASAAKDYSNLTVSVWRQACGKTAYEKNGNAVYVKEIVKVINSRPTEEFLIFRQKEHEELKADIEKLVTNPERVKFSHWGIHTATNDHADIPNVIISSLLTYRLADYEALARASATLRTSTGTIDDAELNRFKTAEHAHHLLQAVCRGRVRKAVGAGCPESRVWLIAPKGVIPDAVLNNIFPNCNIQKWDVHEELKGTRERSYKYILGRITSHNSSVSALAVRKHLGMTQSNFKRDVLQNDTFIHALEHRKIRLEIRGNNRFYFSDYSYLDDITADVILKSNQTP